MCGADDGVPLEQAILNGMSRKLAALTAGLLLELDADRGISALACKVYLSLHVTRGVPSLERTL